MNITKEQHKKLLELAKAVNMDDTVRNTALTICAEEPAELIQAVTKAARGKLNKDNLAEEIADNIICQYWEMMICNVPWSAVSAWLDHKIDRCSKRLESGDFD